MFRSWYSWISSLPWVLRWFPMLILLRPFIDSFYHLKEISIFLSPPFIVGFLTPILCLWGNQKLNLPDPSIRKSAFGYWSILLLLSITLFLFSYPSVFGLKLFLKAALPAYLFLYIRKFIFSVEDLHGVLFTFLLAAYIAGLFMLFEIIIGPIQEEEFSRGIQRFRGTFADVVSYGIYISLGLLISGYFYLSKIEIKILGINNIYVFILYTLFVAFKISHMTSYAVIATVLLLYTLFSLKKIPFQGVILVILIAISCVYYGDKVFAENIHPLIEKDVLVLEGEKENTALFHGRMGRWEMLWTRYRANNVIGKLFGISFSKPSAYMISSGVHNDYLRILFTTGIIGTLLFWSSIVNMVIRSRFFDTPERFLCLGGLTIFLLYSITTTPSYYVNFMYIFLSIFCFIQLDPDQAYFAPEESE